MNQGAMLTTLAYSIGNNIQHELRNELAKPDGKKKYDKLVNDHVRHNGTLARRMRMILKDQDAWSAEAKVQVGVALLNILLNTVRDPITNEHIFEHERLYKAYRKQRFGVIKVKEEVFKELDAINQSAGDERNAFKQFVTPRFLPMVVPPRSWNNRAYHGAYLLPHCGAPLMKHLLNVQCEAVRCADMPDLLQGLDYLGCVSWRINSPILQVVQQIWQQGRSIGEIPSRDSVQLQTFEEFKAERRSDESFMKKLIDNYSFKNKDKDKDSAKQTAEPVPVLSSEELEEQLLRRAYRDVENRVLKKNKELHSLRCDLRIKLDIADEFQHDTMYFPHQVDFRGRAYPVPPNLSHMGSDLCRALLTFSDKKPLGVKGFAWLKVHLANLFGYNKAPFEQRAAWTDDHWEKIMRSAEKPLEESFWQEAESPFQALACCLELASAVQTTNNQPHLYMSSLPVHQDGSCNGLQHYAGLGRDEPGGVAVNLIPSGSPQDVYNKVLEIVVEKIERDVQVYDAYVEHTAAGRPYTIEPQLLERAKAAKKVQQIVSRKVIKQTVMTSVYGVTAIGARDQIQNRLAEHFAVGKAFLTPEEEHDIYKASRYLAGLTLTSLEEMFDSARKIMDWLGIVARIVAKEGHSMAWITPLGLPVVQPYRRSSKFAVRTSLQNVVLSMKSDFLPVDVRKQRSAFPPNFVHSLDATHMLMTCLKMKQHQLSFAAVHDSYWTHAADIDTMRAALKDSFVELYEYPLLEELRDNIKARFPTLVLPDLPDRGRLDIKRVRESEYFFH